MGSTLYEPAPDVAAIAAGLIGEHHPDLVSAPIVYVFRSPAARARNRLVLGRALRITGLRAFLVALAVGEVDETESDVDYTFYVMEIARPEWDTATPEQRAALVDHELCHFRIDDETGELKIRPHDLEEFNSVVARHGAWSADISVFLESCATS